MSLRRDLKSAVVTTLKSFAPQDSILDDIEAYDRVIDVGCADDRNPFDQ